MESRPSLVPLSESSVRLGGHRSELGPGSCGLVIGPTSHKTSREEKLGGVHRQAGIDMPPNLNFFRRDKFGSEDDSAR